MICSLTAYNRPEFLGPVIESFQIAAAELVEPVFLVVSVDKSDKQDEIVEMLPHGRGTYVYPSQVHLGLQRNTLRALEDAWSLATRFGERFVLHLEDDLVLAPDALKLAAYMRDRYEHDEDVRFVGLTQVNFEPATVDYLQVTKSDWFDCHVWGTWLDVWHWDMLPNWPHEWDDHWAAFVNENEMWGGAQVLPYLSRSKSIGVYGEHCTEEFHETHNPKVFAGDVVVPDGRYHE